MVADICGPAAALEEFQRKHKAEDQPPGLLLGVRLLAPGEQAVDPLAAITADDIADLMRRYPDAEEFSGVDALGERSG